MFRKSVDSNSDLLISKMTHAFKYSGIYYMFQPSRSNEHSVLRRVSNLQLNRTINSPNLTMIDEGISGVTAYVN